jgi:hypothetical protein
LTRQFLIAKAAGLLAGLAVSSSLSASTLFFQGNFSQDDQTVLIGFTLSSTGVVDIRSLAYGGGVSGIHTVSAGGFATTLTVFDGTGVIAQDLLGGNPACNGRGTDVATGLCLDASIYDNASIPLTLAAGVYTLILGEQGNTPGALASDPYSQAGNGNFTGPLYTGNAGSFIDPFGNQRSSAWAVEITGVNDTSSVPEPAAVFLSAAGICALWTKRKFMNEKKDRS